MNLGGIQFVRVNLRVPFIASLSALALLAGCTFDPFGGGGGGGNNPVAGLQVRVSSLVATGDIRVDNDVVAVGTGNNGGIEYLLPKQGMQTYNLTNTQTLMTDGFAVANGWIIARNFNGDVFMHDTATGTTTPIPNATLKLPSGNVATNEFWADEQYIATFADDNAVTDGHKIKFIDTTTTPPTITSFTQDIPDPSIGNAERVLLAVDADHHKVMALQLNVFYLYDMNNPTAAPDIFDVSMAGGATNAIQFQFDEGFVVYQERFLTLAGLRITRFMDLANRLTTVFAENPSERLDVLLVNDKFGYFVNQRNDDVNTNSTTRSVWGAINAGNPNYTEEHLNDQFLGNDRGDGLIGYGRTLAATKNGTFRFLAGGGNPAIAEILQVSKNGSGFKEMPTIQQFQAQSPDGLPATNVVTSDDICAFRVGGNDQVGYILLP